MDIPPDILARYGPPDQLDRSGRRDLGRALRRAGWTYREIASTAGCAVSTAAGWCRGITLTEDQVGAIAVRTSSAGVPRDTQWKRRREVERIQRTARASFSRLSRSPEWVAGLVMYWAEGDKTANSLRMSNSDPAAHRLFMTWTNTFILPDAGFRHSLNLHADNDMDAATSWWAEQLRADPASFTKPYVKPDGTGHRKNHLPHGVCRTSVRRSTDGFVAVSAWIDEMAAWVASDGFGKLPAGR